MTASVCFLGRGGGCCFWGLCVCFAELAEAGARLKYDDEEFEPEDGLYPVVWICIEVGLLEPEDEIVSLLVLALFFLAKLEAIVSARPIIG